MGSTWKGGGVLMSTATTAKEGFTMNRTTTALLILASLGLPVSHARAADGLIIDWPIGSLDGTEFVPGYHVQVMQNFGNQNPAYGNKLHSGVDLILDNGATTGAAVYAAADGVVTCVPPSISYPGRVVVVEHTLSDGSKLYTQYGHLNEELQVSEGMSVSRGAPIGSILDQSGNTHLHFEVRTFRDWPAGGCWGPGYADLGYSPGDQGWLDPIDAYYAHRPAFPAYVITNYDPAAYDGVHQNVRNAPNLATGTVIGSGPELGTRLLADGVTYDQGGYDIYWYHVKYDGVNWGYMASFVNGGWGGVLNITEPVRSAPSVAPDLVVDRVYVVNGAGTRVTSLVSGQTYVIHSWVRNVGTGSVAANAFLDEIAINGARLCYNGSSSAMATNQEYDRYCTFVAGAAGTITITGRADYGSAVAESNENNNATSISVAVTGTPPDLTVNRLYVTSGSTTVTTLEVGKTYTVHSWVRNAGAGSVAAGAFRDDITINGTQLCYNTNPTALAANQEYDRYCSYTPSAPGTINIQGRADYANNVAESNESNNIYGVSCTVVDRRADLTVNRVYVTSGSTTVTTLEVGKQYTIHSWVRNVGTVAIPAGAFSDEIQVGGARLCYNTNPALAVGGEYDRYCLYAPSAAGTLSISGRADFNNTVAEVNESNNAASTSVSVAGATVKPDLTVSRLYVTSGSTTVTTLRVNTTYLIHSWVKNQASGAVGAQTFRDDILINGAQLCYNTNPVAMANGTEYDRYCYYTPRTTGTVTITGRADYQGAIAETIETNNTRAASYSVTY
jgi:subtilase family serine protease/murein DD-endopeptidase MepM/ murein hydrolase activator NlpD